jgi:hypothetical protein
MAGLHFAAMEMWQVRLSTAYHRPPRTGQMASDGVMPRIATAGTCTPLERSKWVHRRGG